ncbi:5-formyltetrahydrofolate cyclo-ligase [Neobittarella massiliensis]|uniref:Methenyltetrahydrofolate synthetase n=2 Tax=Oscillospiraceae TaxID=216572 RepID=A0A8J6ILR1_9FIRM|nr:5-formyltetrahydrofolate cyclo-ligase [Neobittarella massiliensis]MBC3516956.1 methenyltetrahydrofolate synthetase [Neobittarella massiliensis]SCJ82435.1 5-formyltetrahydrofolate cyclo-ligase [uncultured Anaerotruncus sp.]
MSKMDAKTARVMIWEQLRKVARPDSRFSWDFAEFITDYEGSDKCAENLCKEDIYKNAEVVFITPDNNLEVLREQVIRDKKIMLITTYGIRRGVFLLRPEWVPEGKEELASTLDGIQRFWQYRSLKQIAEEIGHIDLLVTGASAITPSGIRFGKGHGYFDLEWAMFYTKGVVDVNTPVVAVGHDCQVVDVEVDVRPYDTAIDYIVTPTQVIRTRNEFPKPTGGVLWSMLAPGMKDDIPPLQELWMDNFCK